MYPQVKLKVIITLTTKLHQSSSFPFLEFLSIRNMFVQNNTTNIFEIHFGPRKYGLDDSAFTNYL